MECLKSFMFTSNISGTYSVGPLLDIWGIQPRVSWAYQKGSGVDKFNVEGFKNINIHQIKMVGEMFTGSATSSAVNVDDWVFYIRLNGQSPLINGNLTTTLGDYNLTYPATNPIFALSKYSRILDFEDPITSVKSIEMINVLASGLSAQNLTSINLGWYFNFFVYYTYEGEEY